MMDSITTACTDIVGIFTTSVVPLITTMPFVLFLGASVLGLGIGVFRKLRRSIH